MLIFVYDKVDDQRMRTGTLDIQHAIFIEQSRTADYQTTRLVREVVENSGTADDLIALMLDRNLPVDEIQAARLAEEILRNPPGQGYLTISNALQWRLQYARVIDEAGSVDGIRRIR